MTASRRLRRATPLCGFLMLMGAGVALANASSASGYYSVNGKNYVNWATAVVLYAGQASGYTAVGPTSGSSIPAGWESARGRMFTESGSLYCESGNVHNGSTVNYGSYTSASSCTRYGSGFNFYSYGVTQGWNGSSYSSYFTFKSPNQTS